MEIVDVKTLDLVDFIKPDCLIDLSSYQVKLKGMLNRKIDVMKIEEIGRIKSVYELY